MSGINIKKPGQVVMIASARGRILLDRPYGQKRKSTAQKRKHDVRRSEKEKR